MALAFIGVPLVTVRASIGYAALICGLAACDGGGDEWIESERVRIEGLTCKSQTVADIERQLEAEGFMYSLDKEGKGLIGIKHFATKGSSLVASSLSVKISFDASGRSINCTVSVELTGP
jgi:hypothetical protein